MELVANELPHLRKNVISGSHENVDRRLANGRSDILHQVPECGLPNCLVLRDIEDM
jgi:hypothetical protein